MGESPILEMLQLAPMSAARSGGKNLKNQTGFCDIFVAQDFSADGHVIFDLFI
jgi:hypothetical protein